MKFVLLALITTFSGIANSQAPAPRGNTSHDDVSVRCPFTYSNIEYMLVIKADARFTPELNGISDSTPQNDRAFAFVKVHPIITEAVFGGERKVLGRAVLSNRNKGDGTADHSNGRFVMKLPSNGNNKLNLTVTNYGDEAFVTGRYHFNQSANGSKTLDFNHSCVVTEYSLFREVYGLSPE